VRAQGQCLAKLELPEPTAACCLCVDVELNIMDIVISSRPDHMSGMGSRNDEIVGVDRREIEFARMRSDMARAERQRKT
jgi:hypothetical protein